MFLNRLDSQTQSTGLWCLSMIWLLGTIATLLLFLGTLTLYISVMVLRDMRDSGELAKLHWSLTWAAYSLLGVGLMFDMLLNIGPMSIAFLELPKELLLTGRIRRHKFNSAGWRHKQALWWCKNWLTPFDRKHCE